jgi:hypothetical protein
MKKNSKRHYVLHLAKFLRDHNTVMSGRELAEHLNRNGFKTETAYKYEGVRGTYRMIKTVFDWAKKEGEDCSAIAEAFVKPDGRPAWENEND